MQTYQYCKLSPLEIRLLTILPAKPADPLVVKIDVVHLPTPVSPACRDFGMEHNDMEDF
jgi:hypothetical protein